MSCIGFFSLNARVLKNALLAREYDKNKTTYLYFYGFFFTIY